MDHLFIKTKTQDEFEYAFEKIRASIGNGILAFKIRLKQEEEKKRKKERMEAARGGRGIKQIYNISRTELIALNYFKINYTNLNEEFLICYLKSLQIFFVSLSIYESICPMTV